MKRRIPFLALAVFAPALAFAAGQAGSLLARVPATPHDATAAYAQWIDKNGDLSPGPGFTSLQNAIQSALMSGLATAAPANTPSIASQQAMAQKMKAQYGTPAAQAQIANMTLAQKMAMAQQIQSQMGMTGTAMPQPTAVNDHDGATLKDIGNNPNALARIKIGTYSQQAGAIDIAWDKASDAMGKDRETELNHLPLCHVGEPAPSQADIKRVLLKYDDKRAALALVYLPKYDALIGAVKKIVSAEAAYADRVHGEWLALQNPTLKTNMKPSVEGDLKSSFGDTLTVLQLVENGSKKAAQPVADRHSHERQYSKAGGCA